MSFMKPLALFFLASLSLSHLAAKEYTINTNREKVTCTLNTLTQEKMASLMGKFAAFNVATGTATTNYSAYSSGGFHSGSANTTVFTKIDPFGDAAKNYMAVEVIIKNDSSETISLSKNEYLDGLESVAISKEEMAKMLYPQLNEYLNSSYWVNIFCGTLLCPIALGVGYVGLGFLDEYKNMQNTVQAHSYYNSESGSTIPNPNKTILPVAISFGLAAFLGLITVATFTDAQKVSKELKLSNEHERGVYASTFFKKIKKQFNQFYSSETSEYEIPAKSEFHDLFFIDLNKVERNIFSQFEPTLVIKTEQE